MYLVFYLNKNIIHLIKETQIIDDIYPVYVHAGVSYVDCEQELSVGEVSVVVLQDLMWEIRGPR